MKKVLFFFLLIFVLLSVFLFIEYRDSQDKVDDEVIIDTSNLLVYRNAELISQSDDWRTPNWYVTTDPIEAVIDYYLSELDGIEYDVEDLDEGLNGRFKLQHHEYEKANFKDGVWIYQVEITAFSNIHEAHQETYFNDVVVDPDQVTIAVFYHR